MRGQVGGVDEVEERVNWPENQQRQENRAKERSKDHLKRIFEAVRSDQTCNILRRTE